MKKIIPLVSARRFFHTGSPISCRRQIRRRPARLGDRLCPLPEAKRSNFSSDKQPRLIPHRRSAPYRGPRRGPADDDRETLLGSQDRRRSQQVADEPATEGGVQLSRCREGRCLHQVVTRCRKLTNKPVLAACQRVGVCSTPMIAVNILLRAAATHALECGFPASSDGGMLPKPGSFWSATIASVRRKRA
jgi:hypothetical protein